MSTTGLNRFSRHMLTKYNGTCEFCGDATTANHDYAARNGGTWITVCTTCAVSIVEQVKGAVRRLQAMLTTVGKDSDTSVKAQSLLPDTLVAVMQGTDETLAYDVLGKVVNAIAYVRVATAAADPVFDGLAQVMDNAKATPKDRAVAADLRAAFVRYGRFTDKQASYAASIVARYSTTGTPVAAAADTDLVEGGIYDVNGTLYLIEKSKKGYLYAMILASAPVKDCKLDWQFAKGHLPTVRRSGRPITADEAAALGHSTSYCCFCSRHLKDQGEGRSVEVGYGPVCAAKFGLPWG